MCSWTTYNHFEFAWFHRLLQEIEKRKNNPFITSPVVGVDRVDFDRFPHDYIIVDYGDTDFCGQHQLNLVRMIVSFAV